MGRNYPQKILKRVPEILDMDQKLLFLKADLIVQGRLSSLLATFLRGSLVSLAVHFKKAGIYSIHGWNIVSSRTQPTATIAAFFHLSCPLGLNVLLCLKGIVTGRMHLWTCAFIIPLKSIFRAKQLTNTGCGEWVERVQSNSLSSMLP